MPGFIVRAGVDGQFGGQGQAWAGQSTREYIYNYTWQIIGLFESRVSAAGPESALIYAKEATLPTFTVGVETNQGASLEYKFAKNVKWDDVKVTFYDNVGLLQILREWRRTVWTSQQGLRTPEEYKKISQLDVLTPDWDANNATTWKLYGSWPSTIRHGDLTYTGSDVKIVEVTVTYDFADETGQTPQNV